jgi:hypothetical protein
MKRPALAALALAALAACAALETSSPIAAAIRSGKPVAGLFALRAQGLEGSVPPVLYCAILQPSAGTLDLIWIPPSARDSSSSSTLAGVYSRACGRGADPWAASKAMARAARETLSALPAWAGVGAQIYAELSPASAPAFRDLRAGISSGAQDPLFWLRLPFRLRELGLRGGEGPGRYEALALAWALERLKPGGVALERLAEGPLAEALLDEIFTRGVEGARAAPATVEVINASGAPGIALRATKILRWQGVDVVHFGNAPVPEPSMSFLVRFGPQSAAWTAREALGCPDGDVVTEMEPEPRASVTVILGKDYLRCRGLAEDPGI